MELVVSIAIGVLAGSGVWLLLRARTFQVIIGLSLLSYAVNLFIFSTGGLRSGAAAILAKGQEGGLEQFTDPLPQALVLTAIVIAFAMTAVAVVVAMRNHADLQSDHVDGREPGHKGDR